MKIKKNGFVATSLIYSFFLVFIALIGALLSSYMANKTILDRYNEEIQKDLNTETYSVTVTTTNANIKDGITLTNLVTNGDFTNQDNFWNKKGNFTYEIAEWNKHNCLKKFNNQIGYYYQNINVLTDNVYYYSLEYGNISNQTVYSYMSEDLPEGTVKLDKDNSAMSNINAEQWYKSYNKYYSTYDGVIKFVLGYHQYSMDRPTYLKNIMVINLTASFGKGFEPNNKWLDENIDWFEGTISYIKKDNINSNNSITIKIEPYANYDYYEVYCYDQNGGSIPTSTIKMDLQNGTFSINNISSNIKCNIDWSLI